MLNELQSLDSSVDRCQPLLDDRHPRSKHEILSEFVKRSTGGRAHGAK
jgi:hypothetical protein